MRAIHRVMVLGRDLQVRSLAPPETVREIEAFVNGKLTEVASSVKSGDSQLVAILTLLNIAEAYLDLAREHASSMQKEKERIYRLLELINNQGV